MYRQSVPGFPISSWIRAAVAVISFPIALGGCGGSDGDAQISTAPSSVATIASTTIGPTTDEAMSSGSGDVEGILPDCFRDSHCGHNEECILGYCTATEGIGETCFPLTPTCREDLLCRPDPAEPFLFRCFPEFVSVINFDSESECKRLYSPVAHDDSRTYFEGSDAATFAKSASLSVGGSGLWERGAVYSKNGEYGCYETTCIGASTTAEVSTAFSTTDFFMWDPERFAGDSVLEVVSIGWSEVIGANFSLSQVWSVPDDFLGQELLGIAYAYEGSIGTGLPLANGALYQCSTELNIVKGPPVADAGDDVNAECSGPDGKLVTLDGTGSYDPHGGGIQEYMWTGFFGTKFGAKPEVLFPLATEVVSLVVEDEDGSSSAPDTVSVTVADTIAPSILLQATPSTLWPPNNKMEVVTISVEAEDACDSNPVCEISDVTSNEPESREEVDWIINEDLSIELRAQRDGGGTGRIYGVYVTCSDIAGNRSTERVDVSVPHDQSGHP